MVWVLIWMWRKYVCVSMGGGISEYGYLKKLGSYSEVLMF